MNKLLPTILLLLGTSFTLNAKSLKIADSILFPIPAGWTYVESKGRPVDGVGVLHRAYLKEAGTDRQMTVSVLSVEDRVPDFDYPGLLAELSFDPVIEAYRKQGSHYAPRKMLWKGQCLFYSQKVGRLNGVKVELRGVMFRSGDDWVNVLCLGSGEIPWASYARWIDGTKRLKGDRSSFAGSRRTAADR